MIGIFTEDVIYNATDQLCHICQLLFQSVPSNSIIIPLILNYPSRDPRLSETNISNKYNLNVMDRFVWLSFLQQTVFFLSQVVSSLALDPVKEVLSGITVGLDVSGH